MTGEVFRLSYERIMKRERNLALDGMKGISALLIACVYHLATVPFGYGGGVPFQNNFIMGWIYNKGAIFVEIFFLISGYIAFEHYTKKIDFGMSFWDFIRRRIIRIFPLMWITLITAATGEILFYKTHGHFWIEAASNNSIFSLFINIIGMQHFFPMAQSWNYPAWSLSIFFVCWCIYYIIISISKNDNAKRIYMCCGFVMLGVALQVGYEFGYLNMTFPFFNRPMSRGYICFFGGGLLYYIDSCFKNYGKEKLLGVIGAIGLVLIVLLHNLGIPTGLFDTTMALIVWPFLLLTVLDIPILNKIMSNMIFAFLGKISFSIYLCNYTIEIFTFMINEKFNLNINFSGMRFFFTNIGLQIAIATCVYYLVEVKLTNRLKRKFDL